MPCTHAWLFGLITKKWTPFCPKGCSICHSTPHKMFHFWAFGFGAEEPRFAKLPKEEEMLALALYSDLTGLEAGIQSGSPKFDPLLFKRCPNPPLTRLKALLGWGTRLGSPQCPMLGHEGKGVCIPCQPGMSAVLSPLCQLKLGSKFILQPDIVSQQTNHFPASLLCPRKRFHPFLTEALHACCSWC